MKSMEMTKFCDKFNIEAINLTEFILVNKDEAEDFLTTLFVIRYAIRLHLKECNECKLEEVEYATK